MKETPWRRLTDRGVLAVRGPQAKDFLQGILSQDIQNATEQNLAYAALLTPQGRIRFDMFVAAIKGEEYWLDVSSGDIPSLSDALARYRLRAKVAFEDISASYGVAWSASPPDEPQAPMSYPDPRLPQMGGRAFMARSSLDALQDGTDEYHDHRISLGIADVARDARREQDLLSDLNIDILNGVSWTKGCYVGQEVTARMHHRRLVKKRLFPVRWHGGDAPFGHPIQDADGRVVGELRGSKCHEGIGQGLAVLDTGVADRAFKEESELTLAENRQRLSITWPLWMPTPDKN